MNGPDKDKVFPLDNYNRLCFLKIVKHKNIIVGDYTYYDDFENVENFEKNVNIFLTLLVTNWLSENFV